MFAVIYRPETGEIIQGASGTRANIEATAATLGAAMLAVEEARDDYDLTHRVIGEQLEPIA